MPDTHRISGTQAHTWTHRHTWTHTGTHGHTWTHTGTHILIDTHKNIHMPDTHTHTHTHTDISTHICQEMTVSAGFSPFQFDSSLIVV